MSKSRFLWHICIILSMRICLMFPEFCELTASKKRSDSPIVGCRCCTAGTRRWRFDYVAIFAKICPVSELHYFSLNFPLSDWGNAERRPLAREDCHNDKIG